MAPKRHTLDSMVTRLRARDYADSYVARPAPHGRVSDIINIKSVPELDLTTASLKAKTIVQPSTGPQSKSLTLPTIEQIDTRVVKPIVQQQATPVVRVASPVPKSSNKDSEHNSEPIITLVKDIQKVEESRNDYPKNKYAKGSDRLGLKIRLREFAQSMFASKQSIAMTAMSLMLLAGGTIALVSAFTTNQVVNTQVKALNEQISETNAQDESTNTLEGEFPSEEKPPEAVVNSYKPPADEPRYINIPKLKNSRTRVLKMGIGSDGAIQTPRTTWDTGWYDGSSKPGDKTGAALIVGHVSGLTNGGVFYNLYRLVNDDEIIIEMGDGTKHTYKVVAKEEVPTDGINMNNYLVSKNIDKAGLTLMTCAGEYNPITRTYENRLAVFAVRVD